MRQVEFLDRNPRVGLVGTQSVWTDDAGTGSNLRLPVDHAKIMQSLRHGQHAVTHSTIMVRTAEIKGIGGYWSTGISEDWDLFLRLGEQVELANLDEVLGSIRISESSLTGRNLFESRARIAYACDLAVRRRKGQDPITFSQYMKPAWRRALLKINTAARTQYRRGVVDRLAGKQFRGLMRVGVSALGAPVTASFRLKRSFDSHVRERI